MTTDGKAIANVFKGQEKLASFFNDANVANNVILQPDNPLNYRQHLVRIDYHINDKHSIYGRWVSRSQQPGGPLRHLLQFQPSDHADACADVRARVSCWRDTWLVSPSVVNEFRINASWASQNIPPYGDTWERSTYGFQFPYVYPDRHGQLPQRHSGCLGFRIREFQGPGVRAAFALDRLPR